MRRIQTSAPRQPSQTVAVMGDSLSLNFAMGVFPHQMWPALLGNMLNADGANCRVRNFGRSGNNTTANATHMQSRFPWMTAFDTPSLAIIWGGTNDQAAPINYGPIATPGTTAANLQLMVQSIINSGCPRVVVVGQHYLNYSASYTDGTQRDNVSTPYTQWSDAVGTNSTSLRYWQKQAAAASYTGGGTVIYADVYNYLRNLIVAGTETEGSVSWHVSDGNVHLNALGNQYVANAVYQAIIAQSGWVSALSV